MKHALKCGTSHGAECDCILKPVWRDPELEPPDKGQNVITKDKFGNVSIHHWPGPEWLIARNTVGWAPIPTE